MKRKILGLLLAACMLLCLVPVTAGAAEGRSAMNITGDRVLFSSPAVGGKTANGLTATGQYSGSELKLTVVDNALSAFTAYADARYGNVVRFCYDSAATGSGAYLSAMVINSGSVTYYGRIKNLSSSDQSGGTALLTLPGGFDAAKGDKLYVFNEQCNGDYHPDYASPLRDLSGTAPAGNTLQVKIGEDNFWYVSNDGGETWTSLGVKATGADGKDGLDGKDGVDGVGIQKAEINENGELVLTYTDGTEAVLGKVTAEADHTLTIIALCLGGAAPVSNIILVICIVSRRKRVLV